MQRTKHHLLLIWLIITGIVLFGFIVAWNEGLISNLIEGDRSKISYAIGLLYIIGSIHCAVRFIKISKELNFADTIENLVKQDSNNSICLVKSKIQTQDGNALPNSMISRYLNDILISLKNKINSQDDSSSNESLSEVYASQLKGSHQYGWLMVDILIKLGLLGTIVGFIFMLSSVANTTTLDVHTMQKILKQMGSGMGIALYTTLAGLICSVLLAVQYQILDRGADTLLEKTIRVAELYLRQKPFAESTN